MQVSHWKISWQVVATQFLKDVRANAHAAEPAGFVAHLGDANSVTAPRRSARRYARRSSGISRRSCAALGFLGLQLLSAGRLVRSESSARSACASLSTADHGALGGFHLAFVIFAGDHALEQPVFGLRYLSFGMLDFVLQRLIGFVGLYCEALVAVLARLFFPGVHIHFVRLAVFEACGEGFLGGGELLPGVLTRLSMAASCSGKACRRLRSAAKRASTACKCTRS